MYIRGLLVKAQLLAKQGHQQYLKAEKMIVNIEESIEYVQRALLLIDKDNIAKYSFLVFNCSVCLYEIIRPILREHWSNHFTHIVSQIAHLFQKVQERDVNWRVKFSLLYFQCLYDSQRKEEAVAILD